MEFRNFGVSWKKILTGKQQNPSSKISYFLSGFLDPDFWIQIFGSGFLGPDFWVWIFGSGFLDPDIQWCWLDSSSRVLVTSENAAKSGLLLSGIGFSLLGVDPALFRSFWKQNKLFLVLNIAWRLFILNLILASLNLLGRDVFLGKLGRNLAT